MIAVVDNYDSFTYNIVDRLGSLTDEEIVVFRNDALTVGRLEEYHPSRIVISPGPGRPRDAGVSVAVVRAFYDRVPILGVCLGHQVIAVAFGGRVCAAREIVHGKVRPISHDGRGVFRAVNSPTPFARYHSLVVEKESLPEELEVSATDEIGEVMGVRHRRYPVEGVQFHPESIAGEEGDHVLKNFLFYRREAYRPQWELSHLVAGEGWSQARAAEFMDELTEGNLSDIQIGAFLVALNAKGITSAEIAGCVETLHAKRRHVAVEGPLLDTCGTGGDGLGTYNISSMTALTAAAAGARVAKHGNRAVSSRSGSADFYHELGINTQLSPAHAARSIETTGFAFLFAPLYHRAMRFAAPARSALGIKTIMNLVGPLGNPAGAKRQLIGVFDRRYLRVMAEAAVRLGVTRGMVVRGEDGVDEFSICGPSEVIVFSAPDGESLSADERMARARFDHQRVIPSEVGVRTHPIEHLLGGDARENATLARALFSADPTGVPRAHYEAAREAVVLNTAAALVVYGCHDSLLAGVQAARETIASGAVWERLQRIVACSHEDER